jgi:hypothetical protein
MTTISFIASSLPPVDLRMEKPKQAVELLSYNPLGAALGSIADSSTNSAP